MRHPFLLAAAVAAPLAIGAAAQAQEQTQPSFELPEACRAAAEAMPGMETDMQAMPAEMNETQQGLRDAMTAMSGPMMQGMMNQDPDVAWVCAMIPHHMGAVAMARAGLEGADNEESRALAEKTIEENEKSAQELIDWVNQHAAGEG